MLTVNNIELETLKFKVNLIRLKYPKLSPNEIKDKLYEIFGENISIYNIYKILDLDIIEDFEKESNKIKFYQ